MNSHNTNIFPPLSIKVISMGMASLLPAHCSGGRARKLLLESTVLQCQLCRKLCFGVLVGHFLPSMIGVQR
jgi:hypothetical protein